MVWTYLPRLMVIGSLLFGAWYFMRYRRVERTGDVAEATVTRMTTPENQSYELSHTGYVDMTVHLSVQLPSGDTYETSIVEQFSRLHHRSVGDRLLVVVDPQNPRVVYLPNKSARERAGLSGT